MSFDLADLRSDEQIRKADFVYDLAPDGKARPVSVTYKPDAVEGGMWEAFTDAENYGGQAKAAINIVGTAIVSWDVKLKGVPVPVGVEGARMLPEVMLNWLATQLVVDMHPKAAAAAPQTRSGRGQSLAKSSENA